MMSVLSTAGKLLKPWVMKAGGKGIKGIAPVRSLAKAGAVLSGLSTVGNAIPGVRNLVPDTFALQNLANQPAAPTGTDTIDFSAMGAAGSKDAYRDLLAKLASGELSVGGGGGGGGAAPNYGAMSNMANQAGGASIAAMQRLADQAATAATGIRGGGDASAAALQRIYGDAANQIMEASKTPGATGSSLTPVSGMLAALPGQVRQAGGTASDFLRANQLVAAQDAGFLGELAAMQAPGYATQFARQDAVFRMADQARRAAAARAAGASGRNAQIEAMLTLAKYDAENPSSNIPLSTDPQAIQDEWNSATPQQKAQWKSMGINNVNDYYRRKTAETASQLASLS
jgi:hypothetical protein